MYLSDLSTMSTYERKGIENRINPYIESSSSSVTDLTFISFTENWMYFPQKHISFSVKKFRLELCFHIQTEPKAKTGYDREQGIPQRRFRVGSALHQLQPLFQA